MYKRKQEYRKPVPIVIKILVLTVLTSLKNKVVADESNVLINKVRPFNSFLESSIFV
jgi:hypothetical protein